MKTTEVRKEKSMRSIEEILLDRVKLISEGEWTLLGTPAEVIGELEEAFKEHRNTAIDECLGLEDMQIEERPASGPQKNGVVQGIRRGRNKLRAELRKGMEGLKK